MTRLLRWLTPAMIALVAIFILFVYPPFGGLLRILSAIPGTLVRRTAGPRTFILGHITNPELLLELLADCETNQN